MNFNSFTIDWEDFGQLYTKYHHDIITPPLKDIDRQTDIILELFDKHNLKATFFILGMLAKHKPELVQLIHKEGHEIALHGTNHEKLMDLSREEIKEDIKASRNLVSDIIGEKVYGYRAPFFSLTKERLFVLEVLAELDLEYDSSIMPSSYVRYGIPEFSSNYQNYKLPNGSELIELPIVPTNVLGKEVMIAGGGYVRLLPKALLNKLYKDKAKKNVNNMLYMHPYEFDSQSIDVGSNYPKDVKSSQFKRMLLNQKWNLFRPSIYSKIDSIVNGMKFHTCKEIADMIKQQSSVATITY